MIVLDYSKLKELHRLKRDNYTDEFSIRIHRSLSWIGRAEKKDEDIDARFIFYWIAFNSAYSAIQTSQYFDTERRIYKDFFEKILKYDKNEYVYNAIWKQFSGSVRSLLNNQYIFGSFWNFQNGHEGFDDWEVKFNESKSIALKALQNKNTLMILEILFDRLYTLRNQILHGGATWNSKVNRSQVQDGQAIIGFLVPNFLQIMMYNQNEKWGKLVFPVVET
tara:strand:+ start:113 stop:775 length:663 start_codon:yes stop_codon:yes gene_type:complete